MPIEYMTQAGYDKLKKDLADALAQRPVISAAIAEAREKGDLSENAEYDAARDAQGLLEVKIARLKEKVANARVIDESKLSADTVQLLSKVEVLGGHYWGMTNVAEPIETHIFDFNEDIYGLDLEIRFRRWLRPMRPFDSLDALSAQLAADEAACRELLSFIK